MPPISTNMHFGKLFIEKSESELHIPSFIVGMVSPETIDEDDFEDLHTFDEDGNMDVREFYEQFDFKNLNLKEKSFVLGYYCHLWFDEYYKFNASKLTVYNNPDLTDEELSLAVKSTLRNYDSKYINNFFGKYIKEIADFEEDIKIKELGGICIKKAKDKIADFLSEDVPESVCPQLIDEHEYMSLMKNGCSKIMKSL